MLLDVNILIYAFRDDAMQHASMAALLNDLVNS
jgi:predicted nucleic acid-binding protein